MKSTPHVRQAIPAFSFAKTIPLSHWRCAKDCERRDFSTDFAFQAADAAERASASHYAALALDLDLPESASATLITRLRAQPQTHRTPLVGITANGAANKGRGAPDDLGIREYVGKPVDIDELILRPQACPGGRN